MIPNVKILATGGTIAGSAKSSTEMTGYKAGTVGVEALIESAITYTVCQCYR